MKDTVDLNESSEYAVHENPLESFRWRLDGFTEGERNYLVTHFQELRKIDHLASSTVIMNVFLLVHLDPFWQHSERLLGYLVLGAPKYRRSEFF